jgi:ABC-type transporter Mla maintaining outer membrane lipid asymmetry permease subunit MlaE
MPAAATTSDPRVLIGRLLLGGMAHVGRISMLVVEIIRGLKEVRIWVPRAFVEAWNIGFGSLFIVLLVSSFAGAVTALQAGYQFTGSLPYYVGGTLVT